MHRMRRYEAADAPAACFFSRSRRYSQIAMIADAKQIEPNDLVSPSFIPKHTYGRAHKSRTFKS